uniref:Homeobox domain-containing protein n=1 Tax=Meloidogyne hapla TaxID=6305 RepID=A0A1I8BCY8_MELHA
MTYCIYNENLFIQHCQRCRIPCHRNDMIMRARQLIFHINCFTCVVCGRSLNTGDQFLLRQNEIFCRPECFMTTLQQKEELFPPFPPQQFINSIQIPQQQTTNENNNNKFNNDKQLFGGIKQNNFSTINNSTTNSFIRPQSPISSSIAAAAAIFGNRGTASNCSSSSGSLTVRPKHTIKRGKKEKHTQRIRTVLNEAQLRLLKHSYNLNQRPDTSIKEQLVEQTGLNARVIRVWFQNKRCKDKKRQIEQREKLQSMEKVGRYLLNKFKLSKI